MKNDQTNNYSPIINKNLKPVFSIKVEVRWGEMDAYGHINNAMYLRYMEEARVQLLYKMGYTMNSQESGPVIINVGCTFLRPVIYPDTLRIDCFFGEPGRSSFMSFYKIYSQKSGEESVCEGYAKIVWANHLKNKSTPLPVDIIDLIELHSTI